MPAKNDTPEQLPMNLTVVPFDQVPTRKINDNAKTKLAEFQAAEKARKEALAAPLLTGLLAGSALTDGVTYPTAADADKAAQKAKRLVEPGLKVSAKRPAVRVSGEGAAFAWHIITADIKEKETVEAVETPAEAVTA